MSAPSGTGMDQFYWLGVFAKVKISAKVRVKAMVKGKGKVPQEGPRVGLYMAMLAFWTRREGIGERSEA